jgi:adhesin transport system membrane fusion protein
MRIQQLTELTTSRQFFETRTSRSIPIFIGILICIFIGFFIWASFARIDDVVKAQAIIRPVGTVSSLRCLVSGEVEKKLYTQDMYVSAGDVLLQVDIRSERIELENSIVYKKQLENELKETTDLLATIEQSNNIVRDVYDHSWVRSAVYMSEYEQRQKQISQATIKLERERAMPDTMKASQKILDYETELQQLLLSFDTWRNTQIIQTSESIKTLQQNRQTFERRIAELERSIKNATLTAPISGRIDELQKINIGDYIMTGEELVRIIPELSGSGLKTEMIIDASFIPRVKIGQTVHLRFPGLPPSEFGQLDSFVSMIPADMSLVNNVPVFLVEAEIPDPSLKTSSGEKIYLRPGIGAEARIVVRRDTVFRMILRKLDFLN